MTATSCSTAWPTSSCANPHVKVERVHSGYEELLDKLKTGRLPDWCAA